MIKVSVIIPVFNQEKLVIKAIDSVPKRDDIEIIVCDDGSTDNTLEVLKNRQDIKFLENEGNKGVAYTVNRLIDEAKGKYIVVLGSDDYFYTYKLNYIIENYLDQDYDMVYFNLETNNNEILVANKENTRSHIVGSVKFMRKDFIGDVRCPVGVQFGEDAEMHFNLLKKKPKEFFTGILAKHYNYPRKGSLCWLHKNQ